MQPLVPEEKPSDESQGKEFVRLDGPRIDKLLPSSHSRHAICAALVFPASTADEVYVCATDGQALGIVEAPGHLTGPSLLPPQILTKRKSRVDYTKDGDVWRNRTESKIAPAWEGNFPQLPSVLPSPQKEDVTVCRLDVALLLKLVAMIAEDQVVTLQIPHVPGKPICVRGINGFGVIASIQSQGDEVAAFRAERDEFSTAFKKWVKK